MLVVTLFCSDSKYTQDLAELILFKLKKKKKQFGALVSTMYHRDISSGHFTPAPLMSPSLLTIGVNVNF